MDRQKSGCVCSVHIVFAGLSWGGSSDHTGDSIEAARLRSQALRDVAANGMFPRLVVRCGNKYRLSFWLQSTLAAYRRGFVEFPLDKSLLGRLAPADFWAQERGHAEGVASGVRFVRAAALQLSRVPAEGKPQFMTNPSGGGCLLGWLPARSGLIGTVG